MVPLPPYPEHLVGEIGRYERWDPDRHTDAFVDLCADPEVMRFLGGPMTRAAAADVSERIADHWDTFDYGLWAAVDLAGERVAGFTGACRAAWHPDFPPASPGRHRGNGPAALPPGRPDNRMDER